MQKYLLLSLLSILSGEFLLLVSDEAAEVFTNAHSRLRQAYYGEQNLKIVAKLMIRHQV